MAARPGSDLGRVMLLVLPFLVYGFAELAVFIWVAQAIGWWTLLAMGVTAGIGIYLLQREGRKALDTFRDIARTGHLPRGQMADTALVMIGALLLVIPGFLSDILGLSLVMPFTRPFIRSAISWWAARAMRRDNVVWTGTIEGEVVRDMRDTSDADPTHPVIEGRIVSDAEGDPFSDPRADDPPAEGHPNAR
ncbi:MAG: FxsA family protein [Tessaracoccus sp.]